MKNVFWVLFGLVAVHLHSSNALAETPDTISGTWVLDAKATEESVLAAPPYKAAEWFGLASGYLVGLIYEFDGSNATIHTYGNGNSREYQFLSRQDAEIKYIPKNTQGATTDTLTVSILSDKNIKIFHSSSPEMGYLLWKRVKLDPKRTTPNDAKTELEAWIASLQRIMKAFDTHPARTEEWDEEALLHDGRTVEVHRKVAFYPKWPDEYSLKVKHPDTGESIEWRGERHVNPIMLDFVDGIPYLVVRSARVFSNVKLYGCPEIPYAFLKNEKKTSQWIPVPRNLAPKVLRIANLSARYDGTYMRDGKRQSKDFISRQYGGNKGATNGSFTADIPENYDTWDYFLKKSSRDTRYENDCRPPRTQLPPVILPTAMERTPELLGTIDYAPERISIGDDWGRLTFDQKREGDCKKLFRSTDPDDSMQDQRFINDSTGNKRVPYSKNGQFQMGTRILCDKHIWFVTHQEERGKMIITKYSTTGDLAMRISFPNPEPIQGFVGYIAIPSLRSEAGYLHFDWMDFRNINREWHIKRILKLRVREPAPQNTGVNK